MKEKDVIDYNRPDRKEQLKARDNEEDVSGCWDVLKKLSCTLQCGGKSCSIKETEQQSGSTTPSLSPSLESVSFDIVEPKPITTAPKRRKQSHKKSIDPDGTQEPSVPAVKKVRKISKKKQQPPEPMDL